MLHVVFEPSNLGILARGFRDPEVLAGGPNNFTLKWDECKNVQFTEVNHPLPISTEEKSKAVAWFWGRDKGTTTSVRCHMQNTMFKVLFPFPKANWERVLRMHLKKLVRLQRRTCYFSPAGCSKRSKFCMAIILLSLGAKKRGELLGALAICSL